MKSFHHQAGSIIKYKKKMMRKKKLYSSIDADRQSADVTSISSTCPYPPHSDIDSNKLELFHRAVARAKKHINTPAHRTEK